MVRRLNNNKYNNKNYNIVLFVAAKLLLCIYYNSILLLLLFQYCHCFCLNNNKYHYHSLSSLSFIVTNANNIKNNNVRNTRRRLFLDYHRKTQTLTMASATDGVQQQKQQHDDESQKQQQSPTFVFALREYLYESIPNNNKSTMICTTKDFVHHLLTPSTTSFDNNTNNNKKIHFILASQSPRRCDILNTMGLMNRYYIIPSPFNEEEYQKKELSKLNPIEYTSQSAIAKANALANDIIHQMTINCNNANNSISNRDNANHYDIIILGSDTIVEVDEQIVEKPIDYNDAVRMLKSLSGNNNVLVHTGVALIHIHLKTSSSSSSLGHGDDKNDRNDNVVDSSTDTINHNTIQIIDSYTDTTQLSFIQLNDMDISTYIQSTDLPMDKSGAFQIMGIGGSFITNMIGDFYTVVGLPMHRTSVALANAIKQIMKSNGIEI